MAACLWDNQVLALSTQDVSRLPPEILEILTHEINEKYLQTLATLALDPGWTHEIFVAFKPLAIDIAGRWTLQARMDEPTALKAASALSKVVSAWPQLAIPLKEITSTCRYGVFRYIFNTASVSEIHKVPSHVLGELLVLLLRLLEFDDHEFSPLISLQQMHALCLHQDIQIRYLACRVISRFFHFTSRAQQDQVERHCNDGPVPGVLDGRCIDFRFYDDWESDRLCTLEILLKNRPLAMLSTPDLRRIETVDLCASAIDFAGFLAAVPSTTTISASRLVQTTTARHNIRHVAEAICNNRCALITGIGGSGKTSIIEDIARRLGKSDSMLILHLNAQTDAKLLTGLYTTAAGSNSFRWQPGVLTRAVQEGRWILIEDLDHAPVEVMSVLLPLLDRGELMLPNLGGTVHATSGFKLIGTIRTTINATGEETPIRESIGMNYWTKISLLQYSNSDLQQILCTLHPSLQTLSDRIISMHEVLRRFLSRSKVGGTSVRPCGVQELLRFCRRSSFLLEDAGFSSDTRSVPDSFLSNMFLEALDCFCAAVPPGSLRAEMVEVVAQELQISPGIARFSTDIRTPSQEIHAKGIKYGRIPLRYPETATGNIKRRTISRRPFAKTDQAFRAIESIASAVRSKEPCLLVGETGTGKTTIIQELANALGQKLHVVNLSQQSEAGDLLGGFKPVTSKVLATPIKDEFDQLFDDTLKNSKNEKFVASLDRYFKKGEWTRVLKLWSEAYSTAVAALIDKTSNAENPSKKRKLDTTKYRDLKARWDQLASYIEVFRKSLDSGSKGFVFSYLEGNLIKAVRNGDWVLLDEINLASSDTLESIADLLTSDPQQSPSILMSESDDIRRVQAHPNFRVFAAMNPATDVGKHELAPSIRSRFTELYISSYEDDDKSMIQICSEYLGDYVRSDTRVAEDVAKLYQAVRRLEKESRLVDGADQKPHFTLRTLSRTLTYAMDIASIYGLRRSLYEGFCMSFLTLLNRDSISLVSPLIYKHLLEKQKNVHSILHNTPKCPGNSSEYVQFRHYFMARGQFTVKTRLDYIITPFVEANLLNLVRAISTRQYPILLQGPTSSGKTSMLEYLADISGNKFVRINNHEHTDLQEYLGTYVSGSDGLQFQDGVLVKALREGHWIVLDELNLAPTDVLEALNRLLDDNRELLIPETQENIRPHPEFRLFATQNPAGVYGGRKILSRAFRNRFLELHFDDIPENELETILEKRSQIAPSYCRRIVEVYKSLAILRQSERFTEKQNSFATLRDLFRWAFRAADNVEQLAVNGFMLLGERVRNEKERQDVKSVIEKVMRVKLDESKLYSISDQEGKYFKQSGPLSQKTVMTGAMSRLFRLITTAFKNNEPVLLVGDTGCGKTTICQAIAEMLGKDLFILNAHQNTETGDIIGAQRPIRNREHITAELYKCLRDISHTHVESTGKEINSDSELLKWYESLSQSAKRQIPPDQFSQIEKCRTRSQALFEWADGALVTAMERGQHFLFDEISLADDSVLERLNSALESSRSILLAEKGTTDSLINAQEGFQFLATMNPGGDYGKKELSPALRNRFTEIWVPELTNDEDILQIANSKLTDNLIHLAEPIVAFARWFDHHCGQAKASVSLRQILAWIDFLNLPQFSEDPRGIVHGAAMVYIDGIGADPAAKLVVRQEVITSRRFSCLDELESLFHVPAKEIYNTTPCLNIDETSMSIGPFTLSTNTKTSQSQQFSMEAPTTMTNALRVLRALQISKPILIEGSPGVGKTTLIENIARIINMPLTRINLSEQTDLMDLFGSDVPIENGSVGEFEWRDAPFLMAMEKGEWVLLDEMNLASQSVLEGLNACLDHRGEVFIPELDRSFSKHPTFRLFAAQNPHSQGGGRKGLPASFVNRFTVVYAEELTKEDMVHICNATFSESKAETIEALASYTTDLNLFVTASDGPLMTGGPWEFNLRDLVRWMNLVVQRDSLLAASLPGDFENMLVLDRLRTPDDRRLVSTSISPPFSDLSRSRSHYFNCGSAFIQCGVGFLRKGFSSNITAALRNTTHKKVLESVMIAVQMQWPCLLVGGSGSGKSRLLNGLASQYGATITTLALSSDMDTMDILGGYEQADYHRHVKSVVFELQIEINRLWASSIPFDTQRNLTRLWTDLIDLDSLSSSKIEALSSDFVKHETLSGLLLKLCDALDLVQTSNQARFEWIDSVLIQSMERGDWLVLDNANLCDASVLDRLNALLEPNGVLFLNEHRLRDGSPKIISRHPNFRLFLTMNPRYGELSRAMRNRSVELYMPRPSEPVLESGLGALSLTQNRSSNFLQQFQWGKFDEKSKQALLFVCLSQFSIDMHMNFNVWVEQLRTGLYAAGDIVVTKLESLQSLYASAYGQMSGMAPPKRLYHDLCDTLKLDEGQLDQVIRQQPVDPLVNTALVSCARKRNIYEELVIFIDILDARLRLAGIQQQLVELERGLSLKPRHTWSRLDRSFSIGTERKFARDSTAPIAAFLHTIIPDLNGRLNSETRKSPRVMSICANIVDLTRDICELCSSSQFDEGRFFTLLRTIKSIAKSNKTLTEADSLGVVLEQAMVGWGEIKTLETMEPLWRFYRSETAKSTDQLAQIMRFEEIADRLGAMIWKSHVSLDTIMEHVIDMQHLLERLYLYTDANLADHLTSLERSVQEGESSYEMDRVPTRPYFQAEFRVLQQCRIEQRLPISDETIIVSVLASEGLASFMKFSTREKYGAKLLSSLEPVALIEQPTYLNMLRGDFALRLGHDLHEIRLITLRGLARFREELPILSKHIAANAAHLTSPQYPKLLHQLNLLVLEQLSAYKDIIEPQSLLYWSTYLSHAQQTTVSLRQKMPLMLAEGIDSAYEETLVTLNQQLALLVELNATADLRYDSAQAWTQLGQAYVQFGSSTLQCYLSDHPYDPALTSLVAHERWSKRMKEFELELWAQKEYEATTGETTQPRQHLIQDRLIRLGKEPKTLAIARPQKSRLVDLHSEMMQIENTILTPLRTTKPGMESPSDLRQIVRTLIKRLSIGFREYEDIVRPAVSLLQVVDLGLNILVLKSESDTIPTASSNTRRTTATLFGLNLEQIVSKVSHCSLAQHNDGIDPRYLKLASVALDCNIRNTSTTDTISIVTSIQDHFYQEWKSNLSKEQVKQAASSSLYQFRGSEESLTEEKDMQAVFPTFQDEEELNMNKSTKMDPAAFAALLADMQAQIFLPTSNGDNAILRFMADLQARLTHTVIVPKDTFCLITNSELLPSLLEGLHCERQNFDASHSVETTPDFYRESNISQAARLVGLCQRFRERFREIQAIEMYREHATIGLILQTIEEILDQNHTSPLAKLISFTEKLHNFVYEWQFGAITPSREFSAISLYNELTTILVDWRRIELTSWSKVLDHEEQKHAQQAKSWWFIAFEAILHPLAGKDISSEEATAFARDLSVELLTFMTSANLGQFRTRLNTLRAFRIQVQILAQNDLAIQPIAHTLAYVVDYFSRWEIKVEEEIRQRRSVLDTKMKDTILLASWKDTNIVALQASARRSHNSLFKIIKKYREILFSPIEQLLVADSHIMTSHIHIRSSDMEANVHDAIQRVKMKINIDQSRLYSPIETAALMARFRQLPATAFDPVLYIESLDTNLRESIRSLQAETPSSLNEENKLLVKHLKTRKRNLLSDTLKELKRMGIRSNLNVEALKAQNSVSKILATLPYDDRCGASTTTLFLVLDNMTEIRKQAREHSEELSPGDASRSIGTMEGVIFQLIKQRRDIQEALTEIDNCDDVLKFIHDIWRPEDYTVHSALDTNKPLSIVETRLYWIKAMLLTASRLVLMLGNMAKQDYADVVDHITAHEMVIVASIKSIKDLPDLHSMNLTTSTQRRIVRNIISDLNNISQSVRQLSTNYPNLAFVLDHLGPWLDLNLEISFISIGAALPSAKVKSLVDGEKPAFEVLHDKLTIAVQEMLVGLQYVKTLFEQLPETQEDLSWLTKYEEVALRARRGMRLTSLVDGLRSSLSVTGTDDEDFAMLGASSALLLPILQQYRNCYAELLNKRLKLHSSFCSFAKILSANLKQVLSQGFCSPRERTKNNENDTEAEGVGLGDGEGAEDISKDIKDDEDMSELAQGPQKQKTDGDDQEELEKEENAIDMGDEELNGQSDAEGDRREEENEHKEERENEDEDSIDEEVGNVDELDPAAVDEKLWEDLAKEMQREKEGKAKGQQHKTDNAAAEPDQLDAELSQNDVDEDRIEEHTLDTEEQEQLDPHVDQGENLELPEDMQIDGNKAEEKDDDDASLGSVSDVDEGGEETQEQAQEQHEETSVNGQDEEDDETNRDEETSMDDQSKEDDVDIESEEPQKAAQDAMEEDVDMENFQNEPSANEWEDPAAENQQGSGPNDNRGREEENDDKALGDARNAGAAASDVKAESDDAAKAAAANGEVSQGPLEGTVNEQEQDRSQQTMPATSQAFQKLGEALRQWRRAQEVHQAAETNNPEAAPQSDEVQHLQDDQDESDAQALGPANEDQAHALSKEELDMEVDTAAPFPQKETNQAEKDGDGDDEMEPKTDLANRKRNDTMDTFDSKQDQEATRHDLNGNHRQAESEEEVQDIEIELSEVKLGGAPTTTMEQARSMWQQCESKTRDHSLVLTEELRLILAPSLATKWRGDYRTGKRVNIKRIIGYIASDYKRDKIWMRRSIPSKRSYQIMLAIDDSKSMAESASLLAFESLALLTRSLSMLEVGQICVASFGEDFQVAHNFEQPFSTEAAIQMFQRFSFAQTKTNVKTLMVRSLEAFRTARARQSSSNADLWQLQLIISDGLCEDHEAIRRLVRQAREERIMVVFVIIGDQSLDDMKQVSFETDENGDSKVVMKKYLEGFPFSYYLKVGDIKNLPGKLSMALKVWFAEVNESG